MGAPVQVQWSDLWDGEAGTAWNDLNGSSAWNTAFGSAPFLSAVAEQSNATVEQVTLRQGNDTLAAARLAVRRRFGFRYAPIPRFTAFSALRFRDPIRESEVHERRSVLEDLLHTVERRFVAASLHLPPGIQDTRVFAWRGWTVRPLYTYRIRLDADTDPLESWSESARRIARQESSEFEIVETDARSQARLVVGSYARNDREPPLERQRLTTLVQTLADNGTAQIVGARNIGSNEIDASIALLHGDRQAYYWLAGGRPGAAMTVLIADVLPNLAASGVTVFDFVGANTASIAEFKRKFGGQLTTYFRATWRRGLVGRLVGSHI